MSGLITILVDAASLLVLAHGMWWSVLCIIALPRPRKRVAGNETLRTVVVVPAHNEAEQIAACVRSLQAAARPGLDEVLVVADNCTDETAIVAAAAGATVIARSDGTRRGKGYALDFALAHLAARATCPDIVGFVDADTTVSGTFFEAIERAVADGADAVQVHYAASTGVTALGRLRQVALELVHWSRPLGAARLGLSTSLKGNGMAVRWDVAARGLGASGLTEDAAMSLELARRGVAIQFIPGATVTGLMAQSYAGAKTQDERWERGRLALIPAALVVGSNATRARNLRAACSAFEVASLPLSLLGSIAVSTVILAATGFASLLLALAAAGSLVVYVVAGAGAARISPREMLAFLHAPRFVFHKIAIYLRVLVVRRHPGWQRTDRA